ncbi:Amino-acid permease inda1 [Stygiomarasmius scandens]|uniref:Amino-acid permease inda1 n=1 Tax=Marasmiellus scandens TaxID=2682957 RepID=A0ABR1JCM3_9AGAR
MSKEIISDLASSPSTDVSVFYDPSKESIWTQLGISLESFKRAPGVTGHQVVAGDLNADDLEKVHQEGPMLQAKMKPRHLTMIAVGGSIGSGLFVGSGSALNFGGPAGVLIAWLIIGVMMINALGEMVILYPVSGGFYVLANRFIDPGFAFALGWNYWMQWAITLPLEITIAVTIVQYWTDQVPVTAWVTIFWMVISMSFVCLFGTLGYAEEEFWSSCLKLLICVMFIFIGM